MECILCVFMMYVLVGVLFFSLCTNTGIYIHGTYGVYVCRLYLKHVYLYCVYLFLYTHVPLIPYTCCVKFIHNCFENFWGVYAYVLYHKQLMCVLEYVM